MPSLVIPFPVIDPVAFRIGPLSIYWYALAYSGGLICMWICALMLVKSDVYWDGVDRPKSASVDYLVLSIFLGTAVGGRLGEVVARPAIYLTRPIEILEVWRGGGSFFGAMVGACIAVWIFARRNNLSLLTALDICSPGGAIGICFGRLANFIRPELWGRPSNVPWAIIFPVSEAGPFPRHPSQIYEAVLEGLVVFVILSFAIRAGALKRPGFVIGLFGLSYGVARIICEFFKEPDPDQFNYSFVTMGMLLSLPMVAVGALVIALASYRPPEPRVDEQGTLYGAGRSDEDRGS
jgi:phosphatidylglycerol:prolipoprotein diacylglycerol transferase